MRQNTKTLSTSIAFPFEMLERLERVARDIGVTKSQLVREILVKEFPELERRAEAAKKAMIKEATASLASKTTTSVRS